MQHARQHSSGLVADERLQRLYDTVWSGFEESTVPPESYKANVNEQDETDGLYTSYSSLIDQKGANNNTTPTARHPSDRQSRGGRPLPKPPGGTGLPSRPTKGGSMGESWSQGNGNAYAPRHEQSHSQSIDDDSDWSMPIPEPVDPGTAMATLAKSPSDRPRGAGAPILPGHQNGITHSPVASSSGFYQSNNPHYDQFNGNNAYSTGLARTTSATPSNALAEYGVNRTISHASSSSQTGSTSLSMHPASPSTVGTTLLNGSTKSESPFLKNRDSLSDHSSSYATGVVSAYRSGSAPGGSSVITTTPLGLHDQDIDETWERYSERELEDEGSFVYFALLSHIAVRLRDKVPRGTHTKNGVLFSNAFTGKDIVTTINNQIQRSSYSPSESYSSDRSMALATARSLLGQLFFTEVEWDTSQLQDGVADVYMFMDEQEGLSGAHMEREELPTGVMTPLTACYVSSCVDGVDCYAWSCPRKLQMATPGSQAIAPIEPATKAPSTTIWQNNIPAAVLDKLEPDEIKRQETILSMINQEEQYLADLDTLEKLVIEPLRRSNIIEPDADHFIEQVFGNLLSLRSCSRRLLEAMRVRKREQSFIIQRIGDIFLQAASEIRNAYPDYVGNLPLAEKMLKEEMDVNPEFRLFLEECNRQTNRNNDSRKFDAKHMLSRPSAHVKQYSPRLEAIAALTNQDKIEAEFLKEAARAINDIESLARLTTFQIAMCKGPTSAWEWHDLVDETFRKALPKKEASRQSVIFELIKGEMEYVKDLENLELIFIQPLREADPPIIPRDRLEQFLLDVFANFADLHFHHRKLLEKLHRVQREEHPVIKSITAAMFDAALNFRSSYMEYVPNYPIAEYRIVDETNNNPSFKAFVNERTRHPDARRLDMKSFVNRPIPRLLRYSLLLEDIAKNAPETSEDISSIPQVLDVLKSLGKDTEPGVGSAKQKVELWTYNQNLTFKIGEQVDMDLLNDHRSLIHAGKLLRQPESGFELGGWTELWVILFDNYLVMTKAKEKDGVVKYQVNRRPIPLDLLTLVNFTDPPTLKSGGLLRRGKAVDGGAPTTASSPDSGLDTRTAYPCTIHHNGRVGGLWTVYAETAASRTEWKAKLDEALGLRKVVQESNKVFELETLSMDTFLVPSIQANTMAPAWSQETSLTGRVTCSVPFSTSDHRRLVAIGCAEGVWIGFRHESKSMRRVLHLKQVTQCAMLEEFGIFLVLADKSLFAYHIEALVPSSPQSPHASQTPQKLNGNKDVHFFSVGCLSGRTLVIYMKKKGLDSFFRVLEPVVGKINEKTKAPASLSTRLGIRAARSEWFRIYRDFFLPSESFDLMFLKAKIAILCAKGFEIMDLTDQNFKSVTIPLPQRDNPQQEKLARRCESCRPLGMFKIGDEFLLCYDEFGLYVDKHGIPSRGPAGVVEWEGTAEHVALHPPYVLMFDPRFVEVRHVSTGRLAQIIPGNDVHCIWDGRTNATNSINTSPENIHEGISQEPRVHAVMNAPEPAGAARATRSVAQHVFELIPTLPLFLPGSTAAPSEPVFHPDQYHRRSPTDSWR